MLLFSQRDPRWASHVLGWGPALGTIGQYGCLDTAYAMVAYDTGKLYNPATLDELFTAKKLFVRESTGTYDLLTDNSLDQAFPAVYKSVHYAGFQAAVIKDAVASKDKYVILFISTATVPSHFVIAYNTTASYIADPWTGKVGTLAGYGGPAAVKKTIVVQKLSPAPAPAPAPVPAPVPVPPAPPAPTPIPPAPAPLPTPPVIEPDRSFQGLVVALINVLPSSWKKVVVDVLTAVIE